MAVDRTMIKKYMDGVPIVIGLNCKHLSLSLLLTMTTTEAGVLAEMLDADVEMVSEDPKFLGWTEEFFVENIEGSDWEEQFNRGEWHEVPPVS